MYSLTEVVVTEVAGVCSHGRPLAHLSFHMLALSPALSQPCHLPWSWPSSTHLLSSFAVCSILYTNPHLSARVSIVFLPLLSHHLFCLHDPLPWTFAPKPDLFKIKLSLCALSCPPSFNVGLLFRVKVSLNFSPPFDVCIWVHPCPLQHCFPQYHRFYIDAQPKCVQVLIRKSPLNVMCIKSLCRVLGVGQS